MIIEKLAKDYARFFDIKPYLWETEPMLASGHFQDAILPPGETDILILILWARLGTPLPADKYRGIDGRVPVTGTEWEFETALAAHRLRGAPDILSYKKTASPKAEYTSEADLERLSNQLRNLDAFWARYFVDKGEFRAAFRDFESLDGFEAKLESDLRELIERRIAAFSGETDKTAAPTWLSGNPFRGLETYRFEHASIFFGRSEATKTAVEHLVENAEAGRPFLLVLGASGSGKSSLAQAGIVPALEVRGVVPGVGAWRRTVVRPGGHPEGPFMALAAGLGDDDALPELLKGQDVAALARHLEAAAADPAYPIVSALSAREQAARQQNDLLSIEEIRLILVVDQLEELFTLGEVTPDQRKAFILCLKGLMASRRVFVVATMRSDYWHRAAEVPLLISLAEGHGRIDLLPPTQAEITEMIRRPAEVAGLTFETDLRTDIRLDAALAEEAAREPGALPLLSFLLDALYATDVGEGKGSTLRYASMRALGGLKGAIATRAESAFAALPADAQAALPKVLRALVTVSRAGAEPTARPVPMARFSEGGTERRVVDAFLDPQVRLLVADGDGDGARVRLAHEALITHWDRARRQIAQDRDDLRTRAAVEEAFTEWRGADARGKRGYLLRDPYLANATDLAQRWGDEFDQETLGFIAASQRRARVRYRLTMAAAAVFALTTVAASGLGLIAYHEQQTAISALDVAEGQRNQALTAGSRFLARLSGQLLTEGDAGTAMLFALEALPGKDGAQRPFVPVAAFQLAEASRGMRERLVLAGSAEMYWAAFSPDGKRIVTASTAKTAQVWDAEDGHLIWTLSGHAALVESAVFSPDGKLIVTASDDRTARVWNAETGTQIRALSGHTEVIRNASFSPDGTIIATASLDGTIRFWDVQSGITVLTFSVPGVRIFNAAFSPDGSRIVAGCGDHTVRLWNAKTGELIRAFDGHTEEVMFAAFSPDGKKVVSASMDKTARLWDVETGTLIRTLSGHVQGLMTAMFSPDGRHIVTSSLDHSARLWRADDGQQVINFGGHMDYLLSAAFSPDGSRVVTASFDVTARVWDANPDKPNPVLAGHDDDVVSASFSPDGTQIITAALFKARIWNVATGGLRRVIEAGGHLYDAEFSPDASRVVIAYGTNRAQIREAATGGLLVTLNGHTGAVRTGRFSPDGKLVVTASADKTARVWDARTGKLIGVLAGHSGVVSGAAFSPDGKLIVTSSRDGTAKIWDVASATPLRTLSASGASLSQASFSPDGKRIVAATDRFTALLWDAETTILLHTFTGHENIVNNAAFSPDGQHIATASNDRTARLWDAQTGKLLRVFVGHTAGVKDAEFSPDGKRLLTASADRTARVWDLDVASDDEAIAKAIASVPRCLSRLQRLDAFLAAEPPDWCIDMEKWPYHTEEWKNWLKSRRAGTATPAPPTDVY